MLYSLQAALGKRTVDVIPLNPMLRITESQSADAALHYFDHSLSRGDYYMDGQEIAGSWGGRGARLLGLTGQVERETFGMLLKNTRPDGTRLTARTVANRRPGYDFTFDVPKSVSMVYALTGDERVLGAMQSAIRETMAEMEEEMHARVRKGGAFSDRKTGNMVRADFTHLTTRPAAVGVELERRLVTAHPWLERFKNKAGRLVLPDPHLHAHVFVVNATFDEAEQMWKAGEFMRLKRDASYYQAAYHTRLAGELQRLGYAIEPTANAFEIAGVARSAVEAFSRRTREIEAVARALGISNPDDKSALGALTRHAKNVAIDMAQLTRVWRGFLGEQGNAALLSVAGSARTNAKGETRDIMCAAREGIAYAIGHELERVSEVSQRRLLARALQRSVGQAGVRSVSSALNLAPGLLYADIDGERRLTTREVLAEETELRRFVRDGRGLAALDIDAKRRADAQDTSQFGGYFFKNPLFRDETKDNREQRAAVVHVLQSPDWVVGLVGRAGTGKTTLLKEIDAGLRERGQRLIIRAPTAEASRTVLRGEGFSEADTVKKLLADTSLHAQLRGNVLWIDEAGMLGNRDMLALLRLAKQHGAARVVLAGDPTQIRSVSRGDALRFLEENAGLSVARLEQIKRQRCPNLRAAVEAISQGNAGTAFTILDKAGAIHEGAVDDTRSALAKAYADRVSGPGGLKSALVISPTHREGEALTMAIRDEMRERGQLGASDRSFIRTQNLSWTEAQKANAASYEPGLVVEFKRGGSGFRTGERVRVANVDTLHGQVTVDKKDGTQRLLPLSDVEHFQVYALKDMPVAIGDRLRVTENGHTKGGAARLTNGDVVTVAAITPSGDILTDTGKMLPAHFGHLTHGYVTTADAAQSKTVDAVFVAIGNDSIGATDMRRIYVAISRARDEAHIYTQDKASVLRAAQRDTPRRSATEIASLARAQRAMAVEHMIRTVMARQRPLHVRVTVQRAKSALGVVHGVARATPSNVGSRNPAMEVSRG